MNNCTCFTELVQDFSTYYPIPLSGLMYRDVCYMQCGFNFTYVRIVTPLIHDAFLCNMVFNHLYTQA